MMKFFFDEADRERFVNNQHVLEMLISMQE